MAAVSHAASTSSFGCRSSLRHQRTADLSGSRPVCKYGTECFRRNPVHLDAESHPADDDYIYCCRAAGVQPQFVTLRRVFEWCDKDGHGRTRRDELEKVWPLIKSLGEGIGDLDDGIWEGLDNDGNGYINFSEFADFALLYKVKLPLGLDQLLTETEYMGHAHSNAALACGVFGCDCQQFEPRRTRCKYGAECYQTNAEHLAKFCHPSDADWATSSTIVDGNMCRCRHKRKLHASAARGAGVVEYPAYWTAVTTGDDEFNSLVPVSSEMLIRLQSLVDQTYSDVTTRDRVRHSGSWMVPRGFELKSAMRNENSRLYRKYLICKAELQMERRALDENPESAAHLPEYRCFDDVVTTQAWEASDADALDKSINEWYLWHGTSASAARNICVKDFKMMLAGSATGTLYGKGSYLAESITKADEYAKEESGCFTVLLCRVLGGRVRYTDEREPDPDTLTKEVIEGPFDCVLGDRKKVSGTYREFIVFDTEHLYPEYILTYTRGELFKSPSHP
eukprot:TRINITY_DN55264_c0_g1_i1.p1 TRINITY_DN55264_c0_g1~~TRINITY_DN55264_c0_g1_i1.p1  ORF type:complete len:535 (+),score=111.44 TRINITY_DN55264_c0_g1_i1:83-1606(+)